MAQTDIVTFFPILIWTCFFFFFSFIILSIFFMPTFIAKLKLLLKLKNITFIHTIFVLDKIKLIENFLIVISLKDVLKSRKDLWNS